MPFVTRNQWVGELTFGAGTVGPAFTVLTIPERVAALRYSLPPEMPKITQTTFDVL